jgi:hypothetical protein
MLPTDATASGVARAGWQQPLEEKKMSKRREYVVGARIEKNL